MIAAIISGILFCPSLGIAPDPPSPSQSEAPRAFVESNAATTKLPPSPGVTLAATDVTDYRIGPEDVLKIEVFKEADFSTLALVRTDGKISLPLLNDVQAADRTPMELAATLREQLSEYVKEPKVTVVVQEMNSRRAYVMGVVNRQGAVRLLSNFRVLQAISAAGGLAPFAKSKQIYVLRTQGQDQQRLPFNYDAVIKGKHREQNIVLQPGDTVVVP